MSSKNKRIFVVDDDRAIVDLLSTLLLDEGYEVAYALDGKEALQKVHAFAPHLILLDMNMPKVGGVSFYHDIYDPHARKSRYPVIFLTARSEMEEVLLNLDADGFVAKPFKTEDLLKKITTVLAKYDPAFGAPKERVEEAAFKQVMIVDHDPEALNWLSQEFFQAHYSVLPSNSAAHCLQQLCHETPSAIVIRMELPDKPGDMFAYHLRFMPGMAHIPLLLYAAKEPLDLQLTQDLCSKAGIHLILNAPKPSAIVERVESLLHSARKAA